MCDVDERPPWAQVSKFGVYAVYETGYSPPPNPPPPTIFDSTNYECPLKWCDSTKVDLVKTPCPCYMRECAGAGIAFTYVQKECYDVIEDYCTNGGMYLGPEEGGDHCDAFVNYAAEFAKVLTNQAGTQTEGMKASISANEGKFLGVDYLLAPDGGVYVDKNDKIPPVENWPGYDPHPNFTAPPPLAAGGGEYFTAPEAGWWCQAENSFDPRFVKGVWFQIVKTLN